jgi:hypothetical protein
MKLESFTIENFRAYREPRTINFSDLTTIIGRNDVGKSSILEALEIFFNNDVVTIELDDANVFSGSALVRLEAEFSDLPEELIIDESAPTNLRDEFLLSSKGTLIIEKVYDCSKKKPSCQTFIVAQHPTAHGLSNLLDLKEKELQALIKAQGITTSLKGNPGMRKALWGAASDLAVREVRIDVSKSKEDAKRLWDQLETYLPIFALFQSDRASRDSDEEVQNPLKGAIASAIAEAKKEIDAIESLVRAKAEEIARLTHSALSSIDGTLADSLTPKFSSPTPSKWSSLFSLGMDTDNNVSLNKRGSGVRRLILVSFFKAEAERRMAASSRANIIYAIEEPETSQHPANQKILVRSFSEIASTPNAQVILTTHSPGLAADLAVDSIRYVHSTTPFATPEIRQGADVFGEVADALGLIPDSRVKVLVCVEGPTDVDALSHLSAALHAVDPKIPNLATDQQFAFVPLGGSTLKHWVSNQYLSGLHLPEIHIYDRDVEDYAKRIDEVNKRGDGSWAYRTTKHEIECYLHAKAVLDAFGLEIEVGNDPTQSAVLPPFCEAYSRMKGYKETMKHQKAKSLLAQHAFPRMTAELIAERDPKGEVASWFSKMAEIAEGNIK